MTVTLRGSAADLTRMLEAFESEVETIYASVGEGLIDPTDALHLMRVQADALLATIRMHAARMDGPIIRVMSSADIARCPIHSWAPAHYLDDGTCMCLVDGKAGVRP